MTRLLLAIAFVSLPVFAAAPKDEASKPIKTLINSVRYSKDLAALKQFAADDQCKFVTRDLWDQGTDAQRKEFKEKFLEIFGKLVFPRIRKNFEHLDTILYEDATITGDTATVPSTILINHPLKKQELKATYTVLKKADGWKVSDVLVKGLGDSFLTDVRTEVDKVVADKDEKGTPWEKVLKVMREKAAELKDVQLK